MTTYQMFSCCSYLKPTVEDYEPGIPSNNKLEMDDHLSPNIRKYISCRKVLRWLGCDRLAGPRHVQHKQSLHDEYLPPVYDQNENIYMVSVL